jgi:hypothetical protein
MRSLLPVLVLLVACGAEPPPPGPVVQAGPPGPPPGPLRPADGARPGPPGDGPTLTPGPASVEKSRSGRIPVAANRPREAFTGEGTLWIRGAVPGVSLGQVRFHSAATAGGPLQVICLEEVVDGRYEAEAPPRGADVYVSVVSVGDAPVSGSHAWGAAAEPVPLDGKDHVVDVVIGEHPPWTGRLAEPPDRVAGLPVP